MCLAQGSLTVSEVAEPFHISLPATSKHLKVLEEAGLLKRATEERVRHCTLLPGPIAEAAQWIDQYRVFWDGRFDALNAYLTETQEEEG